MPQIDKDSAPGLPPSWCSLHVRPHSVRSDFGEWGRKKKSCDNSRCQGKAGTWDEAQALALVLSTPRSLAGFPGVGQLSQGAAEGWLESDREQRGLEQEELVPCQLLLPDRWTTACSPHLPKLGSHLTCPGWDQEACWPVPLTGSHWVPEYTSQWKPRTPPRFPVQKPHHTELAETCPTLPLHRLFLPMITEAPSPLSTKLTLA